MRAADKAINLVNSQRDTGMVCEIVACSAISFGLRFITPFIPIVAHILSLFYLPIYFVYTI